MVELKKGGLLEHVMKQANKCGICATCSNLIRVSDTALACIERDKFIMPNFPPYGGGCKCRDWKS